MTRFMLDTDTVSYALRDHGQVRARIIEHRPSDLCMSAITVAELRFGAHRRASPEIQRLIDVLVSDIEVLPFDELCAGHFGRLGADLAARGTPIGDFDVLIAAHALAAEATLVTNNIRHFSRIEGLNVESWL